MTNEIYIFHIGVFLVISRKTVIKKGLINCSIYKKERDAFLTLPGNQFEFINKTKNGYIFLVFLREQVFTDFRPLSAHKTWLCCPEIFSWLWQKLSWLIWWVNNITSIGTWDLKTESFFVSLLDIKMIKSSACQHGMKVEKDLMQGTI